jgi:Zn-finger nucleic acid-binding protein
MPLLRDPVARTHDDRELPTSLWSPRGPHRDAIPDALRTRIEAMVVQRAGSAIPALVIPAVFFAIWIVAPAIAPLWLLTITVIVAGLFLLRRRERLREVSTEVRATMLGAGYCASCGYDLRGIPVMAEDERKLTVCPECRSAWTLPAGAADPEQQGVGDHAPWRSGWLSQLLSDAGLSFLLPHASYSEIDARGRAVELVMPWVRRRPPSWWAEIPDEERSSLEKRLYALGRIRRWLTVAACTAMCVMAIWILSSVAIGGLLAVIWALHLVIYPLTGAGALLWPSGRYRQRTIEIMLQSGRCASCAAELSLAHPDRSGILDCPRCRAAWWAASAQKPGNVPDRPRSSRSNRSEPDDRVQPAARLRITRREAS